MDERDLVLKKLREAVNLLEKCKEFSNLMPEVRVNLVYALPDAKNRMDVAGVDGRITVVKGYPKASGDIAFGVSDHMARLIISIRKYEKSIRSGINFKYTSEIENYVKKFCDQEGLYFGYIDRRREPKKIIEKDGQSAPWKIQYLFETYGKIPTIFYESEALGKEPLFYINRKDPIEVVKIATKFSKQFY